MTHLERMVIRAGGKLLKSGKHKIYELAGKRIVLSHSKKSNNTRDRNKPILNYVRQMI